ncbi:putative Tripeptidyl-peptidase sed2 [Amylocarpus encephaloides]|uniref:tripeptidyl-peptidase II n=1 Tax=Amylocarpus encephaloides TaxID=45428 RepID=A0A9P8CBW5_9HELO|nr:putative Tripeptidyl-peptidase sed2 [Amylocarpus encephaloides]
MHILSTWAVTAFVAGVLAAPNPISHSSTASSPLKIFEALREVPQGWTYVNKPDPSARILLRIALEEPDLDFFEKTLFAVSDPDHSRYGQHLKRHEVKALIKPRDESTQSVLDWLKNSGVSAADIENNGEWINFRVSVDKAEEMLDTSFGYFTQDADKSHTKKIRALRYSVPLSVAPHITMIQPTTRFGQMMPERNNVFIVGPDAHANVANAPAVPNLAVDPSCDYKITPACLRAMYNVGDYRADPRAGSLFGVSGYLNQYAKYDELKEFLKTFAPYARRQSFDYVKVNGGKDTQNDPTISDLEANLDMQYAASLGFKERINYYSVGGRGPLVPDLDQPTLEDNQNEPYLEFLTYLTGLDDKKLPQTLTTSYGEDEQSVPESYSKKVCKMFGELGMRGVSVLFSSGDTGVGSACQTNDGKNTTRFLPIFPAACPYLTSVGGTYHYPERAVPFSSGGFSDRFPRPSYQDRAVKDYLKILGPTQWEGLYNPQGRGFPDIAASGYNYSVVEKNAAGEFVTIMVGGTSASAPTWAALVALLNNARLQVRQRPLGFLNPFLYSKGLKGLNDITTGGSRGCTGRDIYSGLPSPFVPFASWNATKGWDPVTGLGTPDFGKLLKLTTPRNRLPRISGCDESDFC